MEGAQSRKFLGVYLDILSGLVVEETPSIKLVSRKWETVQAVYLVA